MNAQFTRRQFLIGGSAAAVGGAVVGIGGAAALGAFSGDDGGGGATATSAPATSNGAVTEREGMTLGAPAGKAVSEAVVNLNVNGVSQWVKVGASETLAEVLRRTLGLTGTKIGCDRSECSACTVIVNGVAQNSCSLLAIREDGKEISTIEGQLTNGELSYVQAAFLEHMGLQCGFCTPGQIMQATALLQSNPKPNEADIRRHMSGNLCKCSAYANILASVQDAATKNPGKA
jgi:aerobic-type carbon monoxide dehydrogenase small subunit (CoxS/CutS family)